MRNLDEELKGHERNLKKNKEGADEKIQEVRMKMWEVIKNGDNKWVGGRTGALFDGVFVRCVSSLATSPLTS